ncbi:hypothetical protein BDZ91DRAFT_826880 [Kalaharituber pfeilii]|nr:hypothetical protein BDZ91DRAFT_826880 [Kalaharituber pfeilii]
MSLGRGLVSSKLLGVAIYVGVVALVPGVLGGCVGVVALVPGVLGGSVGVVALVPGCRRTCTWCLGDFSKLDTFRYKIPGVPFGMYTATATPEKLKRIRKGLGIQKTAISIMEPINRTNLFFAAREIREGGDIEGAGDLDSLIPPCKDQGREYDQREIPLTIIYVDDKLLAHKIVQHLQSLLPPIINNRPEPENRWVFDPRSRAEKIVTVYHATLSAVMKEYTQADWRAGVTRILVATSVWGMGINNKHVHRVIQWKAKDMNNLDTLIQRFG